MSKALTTELEIDLGATVVIAGTDYCFYMRTEPAAANNE